MKKITIILLTALYLIPAIGVSVKAHYCGGKLASVSFDLSSSGDCACGSKKMNKNCCKTKTCTFKIQDAQKHTPQFTFDNFNFSFQPEIITVPEFIFQPTKTVDASFYFKQHPPDEVKQRLYLLNQVFRI